MPADASTVDFAALDLALAEAEGELDHDRFASARKKAHAIEAALAGASTEELRVRVAFGRCLLVEGRSAERLGKTEEAQAALQLLKDVQRGDEPPLLRVEARVLEGMLLGSAGEIDAARAIFDEAEAKAAEYGSEGLLELVVSRQGVLHSWRGEHREALACFDRAAVIALQAQRAHRLPVIQNSIALTHLSLGDLQLSLELYRDTLLSARAQGNTWAEALALVNMAELFYESGDYAAALDLYRQALDVSRGIGADRIEGDALGWIGQIHRRLGQLEQARDHLRAAIEHHTARGDGFQVAVAHIALAEVELDAGAPNEAVPHVEAGLATAERLDSGYLRTKGLLVRARLHREAKDLATARADLSEAVTRSARLEERRLEVFARRDLAGLEPTPGARANGLKAALRLATEHGFHADRPPLMLAWAEAMQEAGDAAAALGGYRQYVEAREAQFDLDSDFRLRQQQVLYALDQAHREADRHRQLSQQLEAANRELERLATTDALTQVSNRRHLLDRAHAELARARRNGSVLSVIGVDLDDFKRINDTHGHEAGDRVLVAASAVLEGELRPSDLFGRMGGEEFCVLLPETEVDAAVEVAERLRGALDEAQISADVGPVHVTASFGVASMQLQDESFAAILRRADRALYRAKAAGRNRVEVAQGQLPPNPRGQDLN